MSFVRKPPTVPAVNQDSATGIPAPVPQADWARYREAQARWMSDPTPANARALNAVLEFQSRIPTDIHHAMPPEASQ